VKQQAVEGVYPEEGADRERKREDDDQREGRSRKPTWIGFPRVDFKLG
jgi:hypothetical protein